jgi:hypothetical protein
MPRNGVGPRNHTRVFPQVNPPFEGVCAHLHYVGHEVVTMDVERPRTARRRRFPGLPHPSRDRPGAQPVRTAEGRIAAYSPSSLSAMARRVRRRNRTIWTTPTTQTRYCTDMATRKDPVV